MEPGQVAERRIVSVLFGDIVGFTPLGERLDPEDVATIQDAYFAAVREIVARYGGRVEKFIGDAAMAVFGLPRARDDDAERAVRAGLALVAAVEQLGPRLGLDEAALRLRVGINTGEVVATLGGPEEWRITGDTVNTAARLQTAAPPGGVLLGETAALSVADTADLTETGPMTLKGKAEPVRGWIVDGILPARSRERAMGQLTAPLLGREAELARIVGTIREASGLTRRIVVVAPPGVGKSRLMDELAGSDLGGARVLRAVARPEAGSPFAVVADLVREALLSEGWDPDAGPSDGAGVAAILERCGAPHARSGVLAEEVAALLAPGAEAPSADATARDSRFDAWVEVLDLLAGAGASVWLLEDLHWSGPDLLAFVDRAHRAPSGSGRVVVATARPSLLERAPAWCGPHPEAAIDRLDLEPLGANEARALVRALVGEALGADLVDRIVAGSDGNPLFIEELLRTWVSVGTLAPNPAGGWQLEGEAGAISLPATVQAIYAAQIDDLPPDARQLARHGSVAGRAFPRRALEALEADEGDALERLRLRALIDGPAEAELGPTYVYRHALLRDAGYATLARSERARLHAQLAAWMATAAGARAGRIAEGIARHYLTALETLPALAPPGGGLNRDELRTTTTSWLERAAVTALAAGAPAAARELIEAALRWTDDQAPADRARRLGLLGEATAFSGDMDEGLAAYREAAGIFGSLLGSSAPPDERAALREAYASAVHAQGTILIEQLQFRPALALAQEALALLGPPDDLAVSRLRHLAGWARFAYQPGPEAHADLEAARDGAERAGDARLRLEALYLLGGLRVETGEATVEEAGRLDEEVAALAQETGDMRRAAGALRARGLTVLEHDPAGAGPWLDRAAALAEAHGMLEETAWVEYARTEVGFITGDWPTAMQRALAALEIAEANAYHRPVVRTWFVLSPMALLLGRGDLLQRAKAWFDPHRATFPDSPYGRFMHTAVDLRFAAAGLMEPFEPGEDLFDIWTEAPGAGSWQAATETVVDGWLRAGRTDLAERAVTAIRGWLSHPFSSSVHAGVADLLDGRVQLARGDPEGALVLARSAAAAFATLPAPWGQLLAARLRLAALKVLGGSGPELAMAVDEARAAAAVLGAPSVPETWGVQREG